MLTCESALMAKVCEMIVNRDYIRENNAGHPPRAPHTARTVSAARAAVYAPHSRTYARGYTHARVHVCVCVWMYAGAMLSRTCVEKKRPGARAGGRGREDVDIFLRATRECRERHAFDWPGGW